MALTGFSARLPAPATWRGISPAQAAATVVVSAIAGTMIAASGDWKVAAGLVAVGMFTLVGLLRPAMFLAVFMLLRPLLDGFEVLSGVASGNLGGLFGALLVAVFLAVVAMRRRPIVLPATGRALLAIALVSLLAAAQARTLGSSQGLEPVAELVRLMALVAMYLLAANLFDTPSKARTLFLVVILSAFVPTIWALVELAIGPEVAANSDLARVSGPFTGPNALGGFLGLVALLLIFLPPRGLPAWVRYPALIGMLVALAATYSRLGWVFLLVGVVVLGWRDRKAVVVAGLVAAVVVAAAVPAIRERAVPFAVPKDKLEESGQGYESFDWRLENWDGLLALWRERPLFGNGLESTVHINPRRPAGDDTGGFEAHNMVVRILVEGGVVLLLVYIGFFVLVIAAVRRLRARRWPLSDHARVLYVLWLLVVLVGVGTDDLFSVTTLMYAMLAMTGALEGAYRYWARHESRAPEEEPARAAAPGRALPAGAG